MATYGCLRTWADLLGESEASRLLQKTLNEEGEADKKLTGIAQSLDLEAVMGGDEAEALEDSEESEAGEPVLLSRSKNARPSPARSRRR